MTKILESILKLAKVDRRWIFLLIGLVVLIPLIYPLALPIRASKDSQQVYDFVESLEPNSKILLSCEYGPSTKPEIHPMTTSVLRHLFRNGHKVYVVCLWADGLFMAEEALEEVERQRGCLIEWLETHPMDPDYRYIEGSFNRFTEEFSGYGNPWNETHDGPLVEDECHDTEIHDYMTW